MPCEKTERTDSGTRWCPGCNQPRLKARDVREFGPDTVCMVCIDREHVDFMSTQWSRFKRTCPCDACRNRPWHRRPDNDKLDERNTQGEYAVQQYYDGRIHVMASFPRGFGDYSRASDYAASLWKRTGYPTRTVRTAPMWAHKRSAEGLACSESRYLWFSTCFDRWGDWGGHGANVFTCAQVA